MNILFWAMLLLMLLVAVVMLIIPLLRVKGSSAIAYRDSNLGLYDDKLAELETDLGEGRIDHENYQLARQEIDSELLQDVPAESRETAALHYGAQVKKQTGVALVIAVFVPMLALLMYMQLGMYTSTELEQTAQSELPSVEEMTRALMLEVESTGGTVEEWSMLGRAYKHLGQYANAAEAFKHAASITPNAQLMLEQAESLALGNNQTFTPEAYELIMRALELEPDNVNVLWFAGVAEFQAANYRSSIEYLSQLSEEAKEDADIDRTLRVYITKAREVLVAAGEDIPTVDEIMRSTGTQKQPIASGASIHVHVDVSDEIRSRFNSGDAVFVYAKAASGPKMPLAAQRMSLAQLPTDIVLDDTMAMVEGMNLSAFGNVIVSARVTKSGSAIAQAGDYIGKVTVDDVTKSVPININIDTLVQ